MTDTLREIRPAPLPAFEVRFETPPGEQAQVDFAQFQLQFTDEPAVTRIVWLFSFVLGFSCLIWAHFVQDMQTVLHCHMAAFCSDWRRSQRDPLRPHEDGSRWRGGGRIVYNWALFDFARHYGRQPKACRPYRPNQGKGGATLPFTSARTFSLGAAFAISTT